MWRPGRNPRYPVDRARAREPEVRGEVAEAAGVDLTPYPLSTAVERGVW